MATTLSHYGAWAGRIEIVAQAYHSNQATTLTNLIDSLPSWSRATWIRSLLPCPLHLTWHSPRSITYLIAIPMLTAFKLV